MAIRATPEGLLEEALARAAGGRNNTGFWLACQLRDSGMDYDAARDVMNTYRQSVSVGSDSYNGREALASLRQAYRRPARDPLGTHTSKRGAYIPSQSWTRGGEADSDPEAEARLKRALPGLRPVADSPAERYLNSRGVSSEAARSVQAWYHPSIPWDGRNAKPCVCFGLCNKAGDLVALGARAMDGTPAKDAKRTVGPRAAGVFATPGALDADPVAVCEAPIDALALAQAGLPALALWGTSWPKWVPKALRWRRVYVATDADPAGDTAADGLEQALGAYGAKPTRLRPPDGAKDFNEALCTYGRIELPAEAIQPKTTHQDARTAREGGAEVSEDLPAGASVPRLTISKQFLAELDALEKSPETALGGDSRPSTLANDSEDLPLPVAPIRQPCGNSEPVTEPGLKPCANCGGLLFWRFPGEPLTEEPICSMCLPIPPAGADVYSADPSAPDYEILYDADGNEIGMIL